MGPGRDRSRAARLRAPGRGLIAELAALRRDSVALVAELRDADLQRGGRHPTVGHLRVGDLLHEWVHHDRNHLRQLLADVQPAAWAHMENARRFSAGQAHPCWTNV